jgi:pimeloyl-ACP methyl ester carboxylesterase
VLNGVRRERLRLSAAGPEIALLDFGGTGPPALLHHATGFCAALWTPVAEKLRAHFRVFAMDARGHGDSSKPAPPAAYHWSQFGCDAARVAEALAAAHGPLALGLGHSFGGTALALAACERPELFACLVLLDPIVVPQDPEQRARMGRQNPLAEGARRRRRVWPSRDELRARWSGRETFAGWEPRALELYLAEGFADLPDGRIELKCPPEVEAAVFENSGSVDLMELAPRVAPPTCIVWARRGNFPRAHFEALAARMPRAELRDADTGHFVPMEAAGFVADEALAFSARRDAPAASSRRSPRAATPRA